MGSKMTQTQKTISSLIIQIHKNCLHGLLATCFLYKYVSCLLQKVLFQCCYNTLITRTVSQKLTQSHGSHSTAAAIRLSVISGYVDSAGPPGVHDGPAIALIAVLWCLHTGVPHKLHCLSVLRSL